ncbi:uncharacterized protein BJ212DRAFT_1277665 [Suillus subaureus]|uniref:Uncharacterized protein n=1 Tax=Suillus subaureus TaxID=48587 RepID=A0A9P7JAP2_9AGAM|nr:uncharacterized protein BJ212DRAFT_1277665 [Suillus subaureus]KAG1811459.1 hypothetical protein BJ212DRAFT_1277665 [Suillus subaureus]
MLECPNNAQETIWKLTKDLWPTKFGAWPKIKLGTILGYGNLNLRKNIQNRQNSDEEDKNINIRDKTNGASRLMRILISESAYLIWVIRCDSTINERTHNQQHNKEMDKQNK